MKFGCCIQKIQDLSLVKEAGYDFFEFSGTVVASMEERDFLHFAELAQEIGLPCIGFNSYCNGTPVIVGDRFSPQNISAYAQKVCKRGALLGAAAIHIGSPAARRLPPSYPHELAVQQCLQFLQITADIAKEYGLQVRFEALNDHCSDFVNSIEEAVQLVQGSSLEQVGLVLDFFHIQVMGEPFSQVEVALPYLCHVHISTCGPHWERGYPQEQDRDTYTQIFSWLKRHGYTQTVSIEADTFTYEDAKKSLSLLREIDQKSDFSMDPVSKVERFTKSYPS